MPHKHAKSSETDDLTVYSPDMAVVYIIPPIAIAPTEGSVSLLKNYDTYGAYMRKEHFLCANASNGQCLQGRNCPDIHLDPEQASRVKSSRVHRNVPMEQATSMARHVAGKFVEVFDHKTRETVTVPSETVLLTAGSEEYYKKADMGEPVPRMQQCTHFQRKHCLRGPECCFLHVLNYRPIEVSKKPKIRNYAPRKDCSSELLTNPPPFMNLNLSGHLPSPGLSLSGPLPSPGQSLSNLRESATPNQSLTSLDGYFSAAPQPPSITVAPPQHTVPQQPQVVYILPQGGQMPQFMAMPQGAMMQTVQQPGQFVPMPHQTVTNPMMMGFPHTQMMYYVIPSFQAQSSFH